MPKVAQLIDKRRSQWGQAHVNACIADGIAGKPNRFYAFESGHIVGTPFAPDKSPLTDASILQIAFLGGSFYMVMEQPKDWVEPAPKGTDWDTDGKN